MSMCTVKGVTHLTFQFSSPLQLSSISQLIVLVFQAPQLHCFGSHSLKQEAAFSRKNLPSTTRQADNWLVNMVVC